MRWKFAGVTLMVLTILTMWPTEAPAIPRVSMVACRDLRIMDMGNGGQQVTPVACAREFETSVPYVVLYMQIEDLDAAVTVTWQLHDPTDEVAAKARFQIRGPEQMHSTWTYYFYAVLPVAATPKEIVERNPKFQFRVIPVGAKPVSEIPGEWKLRVTLDGRSVGTLTFWLKP